MIAATPFIVVDTETTGLQPGLDHIIELAAVKVVNGEVVDEWHSMVNPGVYIPMESTQISGITSEMVMEAPQFKDLSSSFVTFMAEGVFVAHSVDFDRDFVNIHLSKVGLSILPNPYLCTFKLAKQVHPNLNRYGLSNLAEVFGIELPQAHRALHDARATAQLLIKFLRILQNGGLRDLKDIPGIQNLPAELKNLTRGQVSLF